MNRESIVCVIACIIISWAHFIEGPINWHFSEPKLDWKKFYYRKHNLPKENYEDKEANFDFITMLKLSLSLSLFLFCSALQLTWADVYFAGIVDYMNYMVKRDLLEQYPALKAVVDEVNALEPIKAWIEKRPVTEV